MQLSLQSFKTLVSNMAATAAAATSQAITLTVGSVPDALFKAVANVCLWIQYQALLILQGARLQTSQGSDCDSFVQDFGEERLAGVAATGSVLLSCFAYQTTSATVPPVTSTVQSSDGTLSFQVTQQSSNPAWNAAANAYIRPAGTQSITVPVQCTSVGALGNVAAGVITLLSADIPNIDTATNLAPFVNGVDQESDVALKNRFAGFFPSLAKATYNAVANAVATTQAGILFNILPAQSVTGAPQPGHTTIVIDDGTGTPPQSLINAVTASVAGVIALGQTFDVIEPQVVGVAIVGTLIVSPGGNNASAVANATKALTAYINSLNVGLGPVYTKASSIVYGSDPTIASVPTLTLNGQDANIAVNGFQVTRVASINISATGGN